jgi:hypothetical protein
MIARMRFAALLLAAVGLAAGAACGSFGEGSDAVGPSPSDDAGADAAPVDVGGDAAKGPVDVAPPDGGPACAHAFCADFEADPFDALFTPPHVMTAPQIELSVSNDGASGRALRTRIPTGSYGIGSTHYLRKKLGPSARSVRLAFRLRVVTPPVTASSENSVQVATIGWGAEDAVTHDRSSEMQVRIGPAVIFGRRDETQSDDDGTPVPLPTGWINAAVDLRFATVSSTSATISFNGAPSYEKTFTAETPPTDLDFGVGAAGVDQDQLEVVFDIDDVIVDVIE